MVARRDAPMVGQGVHLCQVSDGCDNRCMKPRLGRLVATLWPLRQASPRGKRLMATIRGGHVEQCLGALRCQVDGQGRPRTLSQPNRAIGDRQQGNSSVYRSSGWSVSMFKQRSSGSQVDVLTSTDPPRRGPSPGQGKYASRSLILLEAGPHRHPAQPLSLSPDQPTVRPTLGRPLCDIGQHFTRPLSVLAAGPIGDCRRCLHVPDEGWEPPLLPSRLVHPSAAPGGASAASNSNSGRPRLAGSMGLDLNWMLIEPPLRLPIDCMQSTGSIRQNSTLTCFRILGSYVKLFAIRKDTSTRW